MDETMPKTVSEPVRFVTPARTTVIVLRAEQTLKSDGIVVKPLRIHFTNYSFTTADPELIAMIRNSNQYGKYVYEVESSAKTKERLIADKLAELQSLGVNLTQEEPAEAAPAAEPTPVEESTEEPAATSSETPSTSAKVYKHEDGTEFTSGLALYRYRVSKGEITPKPRGKKTK